MLTDSTEPMLAAEATTHRDHAIIEQIIAELKNGPDRRPPWNSRTDRQLNNAHPTIKPTEDQLPTQQTRDGGSRLSHAVMTSRVLAELIAARYPPTGRCTWSATPPTSGNACATWTAGSPGPAG